jgi:hypothetical protein
MVEKIGGRASVTSVGLISVQWSSSKDRAVNEKVEAVDIVDLLQDIFPYVYFINSTYQTYSTVFTKLKSL